MRTSILIIALVCCRTCLVSAEPAADAKLNSFFKSHLDQYFQMRPLEATRLGDHRFDAQLEQITPEARAQWLALTRRTLAELPAQVDYQKLSRDAQIDFEIFQHELKTDEWLTENTHPFETDTRIYNDYINESIYLILTQSTLPVETNVANAIARMAFIPQVIATARQTLQNPFRTHTETAIRQNKGAIAFFEKDIFDF